MNNGLTLSGTLGWIGAIVLVAVVGRFGWLLQTDNLVFESDITALLPTPKDSLLIKKIDERITTAINSQIVIVIQGRSITQTDAATDRLTDIIDQGIAQKIILAKKAKNPENSLFSERVQAMLAYKDRLIGERSRHRLQESSDSQLNWRMNQVVRFPPSNITNPVTDPFGTLDEFLTERLLNVSGFQYDGLYLRVDHLIPTNLILLELAQGEPGNEQANNSVRWIIDAKDIVSEEFDVKLYLSGGPIYATAAKEQITREIRWMASLAGILTLGFFLYITRSVRALVVSTTAILLAIAGGLVISHETIGLPHLIGLTMATTAIGICIDFSFHFWIHIRAGMSGNTAVKTILPGLNMSFLTTITGLLAITFTSIPVLTRSAVFICGVLLVSWLLALFVVPRLAGGAGVRQPSRIRYRTLPRKFAAGLVLVIACVSVAGLVFKYHTDDSPARLGHQVGQLAEDDRLVRDLPGMTGQQGLYLIKADSAESLIEAETALLEPLAKNELLRVEAVSRLVISETRQYHNQLLFKQAMSNLDAGLLRKYLEALQVSQLDWQSSADGQYNLNWVMAQPWASIERNRVLVCKDSICASMIRVRGETTSKLDMVCSRISECTRISLSERQLSAFQKLRHNLVWALLLAISAVFIVLYFRYHNKAFKLIAIPILASVSGITAVAWAGMPITVFTLAAVFPLLGLSIDYVIFTCESRGHSAPTFLAIFASALTTSLSFWILFLSTTPAVQFFALPVAVGIPVAWIAVQIMQPRRT